MFKHRLSAVSGATRAGGRNRRRSALATALGLFLVFRPVKIAVIEDHALMRDLLVKACHEAIQDSVVFGARDAATGLELCRARQPDVVVLDLALPDRDGLDLLEDLHAADSRCKVIGISGYTDEFTLYRAMHSTLHGFVDKNEQTVEALAEGIHAVMNGQRYFSASVRTACRALRNDPLSFDKILSVREQSLLGLFGRGLTNEQVAAEVGLGELTVRNYRCRLMSKLGVRTSPELIRYALEKGFTRPQAARQRALGKG